MASIDLRCQASHLAQHNSEFEDQDDFDTAFYKLNRERNQTLLQFATVARAAYLKHDAYGHPLPDGTKGTIPRRSRPSTMSGMTAPM